MENLPQYYERFYSEKTIKITNNELETICEGVNAKIEKMKRNGYDEIVSIQEGIKIFVRKMSSFLSEQNNSDFAFMILKPYFDHSGLKLDKKHTNKTRDNILLVSEKLKRINNQKRISGDKK